MPRFTTSANCTGTLSAAQKTPETARARSETQPEWGKRGRPLPAMRGPEAATPRITRYSATASLAGETRCRPVRPVLAGPEQGFGEWIIVADPRPAVGGDDAEPLERGLHGGALHWAAVVGV